MKKIFSCLLLLMLINQSIQSQEDNGNRVLRPIIYDFESNSEFDSSSITDSIDELTMRASAAGFFSLPWPTGPLLGIILSLFVEVYINYQHNLKDETTLVNSKILAKGIRELQRFIHTESNRVLIDLEEVIFDQTMINKLRNSLDEINRCHDNTCEYCLFEKKCPRVVNNYVTESLINPTSSYRTKLSEIIPDFILSEKTPIDLIKPPMRIFDYIAWKENFLKNNDLYCNNTASKHSNILQVSRYITSTLTKSYSMIIHQYIEKYNFYKKNNLTEESKNSLYSTMLLINDFFNDINVIVSEAKEAMAKTSKEIRPCDPQYHQRGVTYEPLVNFIQAQLYRGCFADPLAFDCDKTTNINTQFVNPDDKERKVQYFAVDKGLRVMGIGPSKHVKEFGNSTNIENLEKITTEYYCIPTICYVDDKDNEYTVRKFSLNTAKASDGYVVTGVKLSLKNRIFYIDIQEGKLLQGVLVDPDSLRWKNTIESNDNVITLDRNHSSVNIDDVYLPNGSFVTGVKFEMYDKALQLRVFGKTDKEIEINESPFFYQTRKEIKLDHPGLPELVPSSIEQKLIGESGKSYVRFQPSDFEKDAGQTTVPYLDIQPVVTSPSTPIQGIGIYYKGSEGYGGFIGLKLLTIDISHKLKSKATRELSKEIKYALKELNKFQKKKSPKIYEKEEEEEEEKNRKLI